MAVSDTSHNKQYNQYKQYERTNEQTNKQTNKQTSRKFPVGFDPTKVIDIQSARASYGIRAHDLPFTEQVLCQLSYRGFSCVF